jgi:pyruvate-ferredoxin/flavodoxin oxidoreductase
MMPQAPLREDERINWDYFTAIAPKQRDLLHHNRVRDVQLLEPLFEFSGACAGCGETPYIKLMTQLFGDRALVANATGCSSIYGGNLPTTPWTTNAAGRGPGWSNSLFEDNAEFGLGMRIALDAQGRYAQALLEQLANHIEPGLAESLLKADQNSEGEIQAQRERVERLKAGLASHDSLPARDLLALADALVKTDVWIVGGDGWAYDIGFGGLDHVLASGRDVNVLVLDTEVYSNTGGQMSKATPRAAVAKFAAGGKSGGKKDLAQIAMTYGNVYVAQIAMGADDTQTVTAFREAEAYRGPSLIVAYSHCIAHGYDLAHGLDQQRAAVLSGHWPLFRFRPEAGEDGQGVLHLDSKPPQIPLEEYMYREGRFSVLRQADPERAKSLLEQARHDVRARWSRYEALAARSAPTATGNGTPGEAQA